QKHVAIATSGAPRAFAIKEQPSSTWLSINPRAGNTPASIAVAVDAKTLREGNYSTAIVVQTGPERDNTKLVRVNLVVHPAKKNALPSPPPPQTGTPPPALPPQIEQPKPNPPSTGPATNPPPVVTPSRPYGGAAQGRFSWFGTLGPNEQIV